MGRESRRPLPFNMPAAAAGIPIVGERSQPRNPLDRPPQVRDVLGRVLQEGDIITLHTVQPQVFKIERIEPLVQEGTAPGLMKLICTCVAQFASDRDARNYEFMRVATTRATEGTPTEPPSAAEPSLGEEPVS